ncbi:MAG: CPBP family intramembrane metalloprotease [Cyanomargarita calcarea GSE-NOS-MK-12-04C]|jgi:membrane protease YdiL (CAAX protease family)|uniref:CPBP family intramembrane metalloprotease n=1 Tax=Cyanomargarita calcarea GSE-NOS-MK-12-04C TaxID=2839659 RepID=A0A951QMD0_9CYAN|nr:CPBP family intramembrane metalloprotease [Cyanomargarita calcarea GSE-NOS-MK-12-04C]
MPTNIQKSLIFIAATFLLNYLLIIVYLALGKKWEAPNSVIVSSTYMLVPMLVTIIVQKFLYRDSLRMLGLSFSLNWWFLVAWLLPGIIAFLSLGINLLVPNVQYSSDFSGFLNSLKSVVKPEDLQNIKSDITAIPTPIFIVMNVVQSLIAGLTINALFAFGEELGWRGMLQTQLNSLGFWKSSLIIGLTWGIWHAPLILLGHNYPQHPKIGVLMMTIFTLLLSPIFAYIKIKSQSVIAIAILHGTLNAIAGLPLLFIKGGNDLTNGVTGLAGLITLVAINISFLVYDFFLAKQPIMLNSISLHR